MVPLEEALKLTRELPSFAPVIIGTFVSSSPAGGLAGVELDFGRYGTYPTHYIDGHYDI